MKLSYLAVVSIFLFMNAAFAQSQLAFTPSDEIFLNPERGFYTELSSWNEFGAMTAGQMNDAKKLNQSLILRLYYLPQWTGSPLSATFFTMFQNDMRLLRQSGMKCILRFAYSNNIGVVDAPMSIVMNHLDQLAPYLQQYSDVIAFLQAGFIGAWGEWHSSTNNLDNTASRKQILEKLLSVLPKDRMVQLRTPYFKYSIFGAYSPIADSNAFNQSNYSRTGHHNDCFLADASDMGTYSDTTFEKSFIHFDGQYVPVGGETCGQSIFSGCDNSLYQMRRLHWTYLNNQYHPTVLSGWAANGCKTDMQKNLGYRIELMDGTISTISKPGGTLSLNLRLRNVGYASLFNPRDVELIARNATDTFYVKLPVDPRYWQSGDTATLSAEVGIPANFVSGDYALLLNLPDQSTTLHYTPAFSVRLANTNVWEAATGYNNLGAKVNVDPANSSPTYGGTLFFSRLSKPTDVRNEYQSLTYKLAVKNYPNPFNNETVIVYTVNEPALVTLKVYNVVGQELGTLVNEFRERGDYSVHFDSASVHGMMSSGIYYYTLSTQKSVASGKMILLK